jgi:PIN domain nuclease of toxin-antitoxin system
MSPAEWFKEVLAIPGAKLAPITRRVSIEAASIPPIYGRGDPGDCFLIATARARKVPIVTRDGAMIALASNDPAYLQVVEC